jgi:hypothetical protein
MYCLHYQVGKTSELGILAGSTAQFSTLMMEARHSSETLILSRATEEGIPQMLTVSNIWGRYKVWCRLADALLKTNKIIFDWHPH